MHKAFLCHSSDDKEYVKFVAHRLGRLRVNYDEFSFQPGKDFREEINRHLNETSLFVFFVSEKSLKSSWCCYELDQAQMKMMKGGIEGQLAVIIDRNTRFNDLPKWLQNSKAIIQPRPVQAARDINYSLYSLIPRDKKKPFVGRNDLKNELQIKISPINFTLPKLFIVHGLEGIGRRSYMEDVCFNYMNQLRLGPFCFIDDTRRLDDIYLWVLDETLDLSSRSNIAQSMKVFAGLSADDKVLEINKSLALLCSEQNMPCFIDLGGMLDDMGRYKDDYVNLLNNFVSKDEDHYLCIIHKRRPLIDGLPFNDNLLCQKIPPLKNNEISILLQQLIMNYQISVTKRIRQAFHEIVEFLGGYPPAAYFAANCIKEYGVDAITSNSNLLVDLKARRFMQFLKDLNLSEEEWLILKYLAAEMAIPLSGLAIASGLDEEIVSNILIKMQDMNLVLQLDDNYVVSPPIRDAIPRVKGFLDKDFFQRIGVAYTKVFWANPEIAPPIAIIDATLNAISRSGSTDFSPYQDLVRVSTVHRLADDFYHEQEYEKALECANRAEQMAPAIKEIRARIFRSLVQLERYEEAEKKLAEIFQKGDKDAFYLKGFMLKKQRHYKEAIKAFQSAIDVGDKGIPVYRDYADCLWMIKKYDDALKMIKIISDKKPENIYILDTYIRILIDSGDLDAAEEKLNLLKRYDLQERFIHHRFSRFYSKKTFWDLALIEADAAYDTGKNRFQAMAQKVNCLIELCRFTDAEIEIVYLTQKFRRFNQDIQVGLKVKLLIRQDKWREAEIVWNTLKDKSRTVALALFAGILELKAIDSGLSLHDREKARLQASEIRSKVSIMEWFPENEYDEVDENKLLSEYITEIKA
jgi:tetratricopeptide (TPR) repeat protein